MPYKVSTLKCKYAAIVASPCCLVELLLAIFWAVFTGFACFLVVTSEINFFMPFQEFVVQFKTRKNLRLTLKNAFVCFCLYKNGNGFENILGTGHKSIGGGGGRGGPEQRGGGS